MNNTNTCATEGCNEPRKPAPKNPKYKQSKYCVEHAAAARSAFIGMLQQKNANADKYKPSASSQYGKFAEVWAEAERAGMAAGQNAVPTPMIVSQHADPLNDNSPVDRAWYVEGGACGFAWVKVRPANSTFANWVKKTGKASRGRDYNGGLTVKWVSEFGQSVTRKDAYARAFAQVLRDKLGIEAYADSRLD